MGNRWALAGLLAAGLGALLGWTGTAGAQDGGWTRPVIVFQGSGPVAAPQLVADAYGQVHGFWTFQSQEGGELGPTQIYHTRLDQPNWQPVDILITDNNTTGLIAAGASNGLNLLWDGDFYAWAGRSPEASAKAWHGPMGLQTGYPFASLASAPDGTLWMAYGAAQSNEIYVQRLNATTETWDPALLVSDPVNTNGAPDALRMAIARDGTLHVVWAEYELPNGWPPQGLFYSQSTDDGLTWSIPRRIAGPNTNQPNVVTGLDQEVYLTWTGTAGSSDKYFQESLDGGVSWTEPLVVLPGETGGSEGPPNLAVDSAGNLHLVVSDSGCVWYLSREGEEWSAPECLSESIAPSLWIEYPAMALGMGNQLHVLFWTEGRQIWYTTRTLPVQGATPAPLPPEPTATPAPPTATAVLTPTNTPLPDYGAPPPANAISMTGYLAMAAGAAPVVVVVLVLFVIKPRRRQ